MRTFLIGMCDVFLILYLTAITNVQPPTFLTVDDFYELSAKFFHQCHAVFSLVEEPGSVSLCELSR